MTGTKPRQSEESDGTQQQRGPRLVLRLQTGVGQSGKAFDAEILNLSPSGMLVKTTARLSLDDPLHVVLPNTGPVAAKVVWFDEQLYGCSFAAPLSDADVEAANEVAQGSEEGHGVDSETLGERIRRLRTRRGLPMRALADVIGVSKPTLWKWESDQVRPRHAKMQRLAVELGVSELELVYGAPGDGVDETGEPGSLAEIVRQARKTIADAAGVDESSVDVRIDWGEAD